MDKSVKKWLIAAASLVTVGIVMFAAVMTVYHWDFSRLGTDKLETKTYEISEEFSDIKLNTETADILFTVSNDNSCKVVCREQKNEKHAVYVQNDTLTVSAEDERVWYEHIGINLHSPELTVYLTKSQYASLCIKGSTGNIEIPKEIKFENADISISTGNINLLSSVLKSVKIKTTTGDIKVKSITAQSMDISVSTGEISVSDTICNGDLKTKVTTGEVKTSNVRCQNLISSGSTGDIFLKNIIAEEKISVKRSTGNVLLDHSDAAEIYVKTSTGDVIGTLLSEKVFITETSTGSVNVPKTTTGGKCEIVTSTGDIIVKKVD